MRRPLLLLLLVGCKREPAMTVAQYEATNTRLVTDVTALFVADGTDCTRLAGDLTTFMASRDGDMKAVVAWEASHAREKIDYDQRTGSKLLDEFAQKASAGLGACMSDPTFKRVRDRFTKN
jgi:hypothetical protein